MPDEVHNRLERRTAASLESLEQAGLRRELRPPSGVDLCSNDYLGLSAHSLLKQRMTDAICREGVGSTGSRLLRGQRDGFSRIEERFAAFKGSERALYFSSGYLANLAALSTLTQAGDVIFSDRLNHASLIDGARLSRARCVVFPHNDAAALAEMLHEAGPEPQKFIVVESLFSMEGDRAPLADYAELSRQTGAVLIVDEAHAAGVYGARGSGWIEESGIGDRACLSINTAGKALGVAGAFLAGPAWAIEFLVQRARPFVFSTAPPPAIAAALDASLDVIEAEPERRDRLRALARHLRARLNVTGDSHIVPIVLGSNEHATSVAEKLQEHGFDVRAIRPPTVPDGTARLRISVNVNLSETILDEFVERLCEACS